MNTELDKKHHVFPWWLGFTLDNPIRRMMHPATKILSPYVSSGMTTMDFGCGFGHYSMGMAELVGPTGKVFSVDIQKQMLKKVIKRSVKKQFDNIITTHLSGQDSIGLKVQVDFILMSNSLHETPDPESTLKEMFTLLKPAGKLLLLEPNGHGVDFADEIRMAVNTGLKYLSSPKVSTQQTALFQKEEE